MVLNVCFNIPIDGDIDCHQRGKRQVEDAMNKTYDTTVCTTHSYNMKAVFHTSDMSNAVE